MNASTYVQRIDLFDSNLDSPTGVGRRTSGIHVTDPANRQDGRRTGGGGKARSGGGRRIGWTRLGIKNRAWSTWAKRGREIQNAFQR